MSAATAARADDEKAERIAAVTAELHQRLDGKAVPAMDRFLGIYYRNVPPGDVLEQEMDALCAAPLGLWRFAAERRPGAPKIRLFNPRYEDHGWRSRHTAIEIVNDDMSFLVDSVAGALSTMGLSVHLIVHPVLAVRRDAEGRLVDLADPADHAPDMAAESWMHVTVEERTDAGALERIRARLSAVLADVRVANEDWAAMMERLDGTLDALRQEAGGDPVERSETLAFLEWMRGDHFTFLGYREYRQRETDGRIAISIVPKSGLGILRDSSVLVFDGARSEGRVSEAALARLRGSAPLLVIKGNLRATVHRTVPLDVVTLKLFDAEGKVAGERLFAGLFTATAYVKSARDIPYLRAKVARTLARAGLDPWSHDGKALTQILDTYPRDELFQIADDELLDIARRILNLQDRTRSALFVRHDPFGRFISCLVYVPRDRVTGELRTRVARILAKGLRGAATEVAVQSPEGVHARLHFLVETPAHAAAPDPLDRIEAAIAEACRSWGDRLQSALIEKFGEERGLALLRRYVDAFPAGYRADTPIQAAAVDIERIEAIGADGAISQQLYRPIGGAADAVQFKLYHRGQPVALSDVLPMLENMGFKVVSEVPTDVRLGDEDVWIHDFALERRGGTFDLGRSRPLFESAFARLWTGAIENDRFNRLVLAAGLDWRSVVLLRAYAKFLRQARFAFSQETIEDTLYAHPITSGLIVALFRARFDPDLEGDRAEAAKAAHDRIVEALDEIANLDEDRVLRRYLNLVQSTLRTNSYQLDADGAPKPYISFKFDSLAIEDLPLPRPFREIFVYAARMEGVHLRGGKVARGGIRWSDRREDFRTEILGLMKAQMVKNAVIVPVGSKGGFVLKRPPTEGGREALQAEGVECYRMLMRGLLDITDSIAGGQTRYPERVVRHDEDDPYLVVAADKGTATFSDIANSISQDYGFWLDDAFASGGSAGYDHKRMGITARGAWESVKRHFREMGIDTQAQDFTCVGVGDMAGDVFGNGMLQSRHIRLVGAFNHLHIFVDPEPDAAASFAERRRLFDLARGSWDQYDATLLSRGGGVFDRRAKSIRLAPEAQARFDLPRAQVAPAELIAAMLRADVDLLWFGGIGTYVKAGHESHADVGDKANDALRVDAREVRARVIGEGANLAVTQYGRIDYARAGGRLNTDFIDNSAGVDTSDHEVNIKILLGDVIQAGDMTLKQRNHLLQSMTDEVAHLVLRDNYQQTQSLSLSLGEGFDTLDQQIRLIRRLERAGQLNRAIEMLPNDEELTERQAAREGLSRPELAILLAYGKITLYDALLATDLPDDPALVDSLYDYFPEELRQGYREAILRHRLRREIVATHVTSSMVNRVGPTFVSELIDRTGMGPADIARAYLVVRESFGLRELWSGIEALDNRTDALTQIGMMLATRRLVERGAAWILRRSGGALAIGEWVAKLQPGLAAVDTCLETALFDDARAVVDARAARLTADGVPEALARKVARLNLWSAGLDIIRIAEQVIQPVDEVAPIYFEIGRRFGLAWLRDGATKLPTANHWQKQAIGAIVEDLLALQADLAVAALAEGGETLTGRAALDAWIGRRRASVDRVDQLIAELRAVEQIDLSMLAVANRGLRGLAVG
jgi:glutamate dehydrogenase